MMMHVAMTTRRVMRSPSTKRAKKTLLTNCDEPCDFVNRRHKRVRQWPGGIKLIDVGIR